MPLKDFAEFLDPFAPVYKGKAYPLPVIGLADAPRLWSGLDPNSDVILSNDEVERLLLGDALEQMAADNVPPAFVRFAALAAICDFTQGREAANAMWAEGPTAGPKAGPVTDPVGSEPSTSTGEDISTPSPVRGSGTTTSPKTSSRRPTPKRAPRSAGTRSSTSGNSSTQGSTPSSGSTS